MDRMNVMLRKCKSLSLSRLGRSSSYTSLRSRSTRLDEDASTMESRAEVVVLVGSSRRRYNISEKHLNHPLMNALIEHNARDKKMSVKCEVVLFDHLLWMLENADPGDVEAEGSLEELAQLYAY